MHDDGWSRRNLIRLSGAALASPSWLPCAAEAAPLVGVTDANVAAALEEWRQWTALSFPLPNAAFRAGLLDGRVMKTRIGPRGAALDGAMAMALVPRAKEAMWLGSADGQHLGDESNGQVIAHHLPIQGDEMFRWYGFVDLPAPFTDRHFLIRTTVNRKMAVASGGRMWERTWSQEPDGRDTMRPLVAAGKVAGLDVATFDSAIYVPANIGGWLFIDLPGENCLFAYHASTSLGGEIPDGLVNRFVFWTMDKIVASVAGRAEQMKQHYTGDHSPILGGNGLPVPTFGG